jgi:hypothetical protein
MRVKAIRDHFTDGHYRTAGEVFEHTGKLHEHIKQVDKSEKKTDGEEDEEATK